MRSLLLVAFVLSSTFGGVSDLYGKDYSWGKVTVLRSDKRFLEFEWVMEWPEAASNETGVFDPSMLELPGSQLTPESSSVVPLTIGASFSLPASQGVSIEILDFETEEFFGVSGSEVDRALRTLRYRDFVSTGNPTGVDFLNVTSENINRLGADGLPKFVGISSVGWLREHRVLTLQCHPVRVDRDQERVERLKRLTGRLHISEPVAADEVAKRAQRLRSKVFDDVVGKQVVNPIENLVQSSSKNGLRKAAHSGVEDEGEHLRVSFVETGIYELSAASLASQGLELLEIESTSFQLFDGEGELPLHVVDGGDGRLDGRDRIVFYGEKLRSIYSVTNSYVLRWGEGEGVRMSEEPASVSGSVGFPSESLETAHFEEDLHYWQNMVDGEGEDHWFWESQLSGPDRRDYTVNVTDISAASSDPVRLAVAMKGLSSIPEVTPDHHTRIYLNGSLVGDSLWDGNARFVQEATLDVSQLIEGDNVIGVEIVGDLPVALDQVFIDWIEIDYPRRLVADDGHLAFNGGFGPNLVSGFRNDSIEIYDVTDARSVSRLTEETIQLAAQGFTAAFESSRFPVGRFVVLDRFGFRSPTDLELVSSSHWKRSDHQADYLIISHRSFVPSLHPLAQRKREQGISVAVIPVDDLYDEFSGGVPTAEAIKSFVSFAYHEWEDPAPAYLLLVGDSTIDPRDIFESGTPNLVPSEITEMNFFGESVSDDGFARVDGDDVLPDLLVGRLPAESLDGLALMIQKTLDYERLETDQEWNSQVLVVADDDSEVYEVLSESLVNGLPDGFDADRVYLSSYPPGDPTSDIVEELNEGQLMVNYTGHGSRSTWGIGDIGGIMLENADAAVLTNGEALSVVTVANCLNGFFVARSAKPCLAEIFLRNSSGGAVAAWAPTSLGFPSGHRLLVGKFYEEIFLRDQIELGAAVLGAKVATLTDGGFFADQVKSYTFFGDPALQLAVPNRISPVVITIALSDEGDLELLFNARDGREYVIESSPFLGVEAVWEALPGAPHNSGNVRIASDEGGRYFRVASSLSESAPAVMEQ